MRPSMLRSEMARRHEEHLVSVLGGHRSVGSGNQWHAPIDGRHNSLLRRFAFAWEAKSTRAASFSITEVLWDKAVLQAGMERPLLAVRLYGDDRLVKSRDWVMLSLDDFAELLEAAGEDEVEDAEDA